MTVNSTMQSKYEFVAEEIVRRTLPGCGKDGKLPSVRNLMADYGVSQATVMRSLETLAQNGLIRHIPGNGYFSTRHFRANNIPQGNNSMTSRRVSRVFQIDFCSFFSSHCMAVNSLYIDMLMELIANAGQGQAILNALVYDQMGDLQIFRERFETSAARICILFGCPKIAFENVLRNIGMPCIHLYPNLRDSAVKVLQIDNRQAMEALILPLLKNGHRRFGMLHGQESYIRVLDQEERIEAFRAILTENGIPEQQQYCRWGGFDPKSGYVAGMQLLSLPKEQRPTALLCNDGNVEGVYQVCSELNLRIPEDVCLTGFDNSVGTQQLSPALTNVDIDWHNAVHQAVDLAFAIASGTEENSGMVKLPVAYIPRESTNFVIK